MLDPDERLDAETIRHLEALAAADAADIYLAPVQAVSADGSTRRFVPKPFLFKSSGALRWILVAIAVTQIAIAIPALLFGSDAGLPVVRSRTSWLRFGPTIADTLRSLIRWLATRDRLAPNICGAPQSTMLHARLALSVLAQRRERETLVERRTLTARPSGSVTAPEIVPTEDCCAVRFAATRTKRGSHLMYGLYMPTLMLEVRSAGIVKARLTINRVR